MALLLWNGVWRGRTEGRNARRSADLHPCVAEERVFGHGQVRRRRALTDAARGVVDRAVARALPALVLPFVAERHAAEMGADAADDQPFRLLDPLLVGL